jgi:hypothetical protein
MQQGFSNTALLDTGPTAAAAINLLAVARQQRKHSVSMQTDGSSIPQPTT